MSHKHQVNYSNINKFFWWAIILNFVYVLFEAFIGIKIKSTSLISDAGHNFSDVLSLIIGLLSVFLLKFGQTKRLSYGFRKTTVLAALLNSVLLLVAVGLILGESVKKITNPSELPADPIIWVATIGIIINAMTAMFFIRWSKHDLNIKAVFWHLVADALVSIAVVGSGLIMRFWHLYWIDGLMGIIVGIVILFSTWGVFKESLLLIIDAIPSDIDLLKIKREIEKLPEVKSVHHLHVWALSTTEYSMTAHIVLTNDILLSQLEKINNKLKNKLKELKINHITLEYEPPTTNCEETNC